MPGTDKSAIPAPTRLREVAETVARTAGWADAAAGFGVNAWDVTAAILILERAGGSYHPLTLDKQPDGTPAHHCPGYMAQGPGARYPTLHRVAEAVDARRRAGTMAPA